MSDFFTNQKTSTVLSIASYILLLFTNGIIVYFSGLFNKVGISVEHIEMIKKILSVAFLFIWTLLLIGAIMRLEAINQAEEMAKKAAEEEIIKK